MNGDTARIGPALRAAIALTPAERAYWRAVQALDEAERVVIAERWARHDSAVLREAGLALQGYVRGYACNWRNLGGMG